jgi:hypothetical protein
MGHIEKLAIIALLNLLVYWKSFYYGYVGDDVERSMREQVFHNMFHRWWIQFIGLKHRNPMVSHALTTATHTICCLLIYWTFGHNWCSFVTALLFSINPINTQGAVWISGRNYVTSAILCLLMFMFPFGSWAFYTATSHFAVNAWFSPLLFLGTKYWYCVFIIPVVWLLTQNNKQTLSRKLWDTGGIKTTNTEMRAIKWQKIFPFSKTFLYYFGLCLFPFKLGIEHSYLRGFGTNKTDNHAGYKLDWQFCVGLGIGLFIALWGLICIISGWNPICYGLVWFAVNIAMWCNFVTYQQHIAERYCYLANIGLMWALANIISPYPVLVTAFLVAYLIRLLWSMDTYQNDWCAVEYTLKEFRNLSYMWVMRGVKKYMAHDYPGALMDFNEAVVHKPHDLKGLFNLSTCFLIVGDVVRAREFYDRARANIYDELEKEVMPAFTGLEEQIKLAEEKIAKGDKGFSIDLAKLMVVKALTIFFPMVYLLGRIIICT